VAPEVVGAGRICTIRNRTTYDTMKISALKIVGKRKVVLKCTENPKGTYIT
jgi:hypothetical protein